MVGAETDGVLLAQKHVSHYCLAVSYLVVNPCSTGCVCVCVCVHSAMSQWTCFLLHEAVRNPDYTVAPSPSRLCGPEQEYVQTNLSFLIFFFLPRLRTPTAEEKSSYCFPSFLFLQLHSHSIFVPGSSLISAALLQVLRPSLPLL